MLKKTFRILLILILAFSLTELAYGRAGGGGGSSKKRTSSSSSRSYSKKSSSHTSNRNRSKRNGSPLVALIIVGAIAVGIGTYVIVRKVRQKKAGQNGPGTDQ